MSRFDDDSIEPTDREWYPEWVNRWMERQGVKPGWIRGAACASDTYGAVRCRTMRRGVCLVAQSDG